MNEFMDLTSNTRDRSREIAVNRRLRAPKALVLDFWCDPVKLSTWLGGSGFTTNQEIDFCSVSDWRFTMHGPKGTSYPNDCQPEAVSPEGKEDDHANEEAQISFQVRVTLIECGANSTELALQAFFPSAVALDDAIDIRNVEEGLLATISRLETVVEQAVRLEAAKTTTRQALYQARDRFIHQLEMVPEDRLNWSPSPSARTAIEIAHHVAMAIRNLHQTMLGNRFSVPTMELADQEFRAAESLVKDRDVVVGMITENVNAFDSWLESLTYEMLDSMIWMPFNLGHFPLELVLSFPAMHTNSHIPQMEYLQTIYGDRVWH